MYKKIIVFTLAGFMLFGITYCQQKSQEAKSDIQSYEVTKTEAEWKAQLSPEQFQVLRQKGTEYAYTGKYFDYKKKGIYVCAACGNPLFSSKTKYNSGSGWPSFYQPASKEAVDLVKDYSGGMLREEVVCARCGGHLGHVFNDGPKPTGLRYCVNSVAMDFKQK